MAKIVLTEEASTPSTPATGRWGLYAKAAGIFQIDDAGVETQLGSSGAMTLSGIETVTGAKTFNDGKLLLAGATSGASTLKAPAIASTYVHTLPAGTDTIVGEAFAQTLTNKTLTTPVINNASGIGQTRFIVKAANETVNNSAVLQNDDDFSFAIAANEKYLVKLWLVITAANATMDFKAGWSYPASCTAYWQGMGLANSTEGGWAVTSVGNSPSAVKAINGTHSSGTFAGTSTYAYTAIIINSSTAGTINFQWAQDTANASDLTVLANSVMEYTRIA